MYSIAMCETCILDYSRKKDIKFYGRTMYSLALTMPFSVITRFMAAGGWFSCVSPSVLGMLSTVPSSCATSLAFSVYDLAWGGKLRAQCAFVTFATDREIRCSSELEWRYSASPAFVNVKEEIPLIKTKRYIRFFELGMIIEIQNAKSINLMSSLLIAAAFNCLLSSGILSTRQSPRFVKQSKQVSSWIPVGSMGHENLAKPVFRTLDPSWAVSLYLQ